MILKSCIAMAVGACCGLGYHFLMRAIGSS